MASKRFLIVPEDSSAARMPFPGATIFSAIVFRSVRFISKGPSSTHVLRFQRRHPRQALAFDQFQEGAPGCRDEGEILGHASGVEGIDCISAARHCNKLAG